MGRRGFPRPVCDAGAQGGEAGDFRVRECYIDKTGCQWGLIMARHIIDRDTLRDTGLRLREFLRIERQGGLHPAVLRLHAGQGRATEDRLRLQHFLRIQRGHRA